MEVPTTESQLDSESPQITDHCSSDSELAKTCQKNINKFKTLTHDECFGINFIDKDDENWSAQCKATCLTNSYLITLSKKNYLRIKERIHKKQKRQELNFLRGISQLNNMSKRILTRIWQQMKPKKMLRNQILFKEGDVSRFVYIVKEGQFSINKLVF